MGYRRFDKQALRIDMAEKLLREAHGRRAASAGKKFWIDPALARSTGLSNEAHMHLLRIAGFAPQVPPALAEGLFGPPAPPLFRWRPPRRPEPGEQGARQQDGRAQQGRGKPQERKGENRGKPRAEGDKPKGPRPPRPAQPVHSEPAPGNAFAALAALVGRV
jgi:ATP-dependent RNA helicase SUPV3L1/SUV3